MDTQSRLQCLLWKFHPKARVYPLAVVMIDFSFLVSHSLVFLVSEELRDVRESCLCCLLCFSVLLLVSRVNPSICVLSGGEAKPLIGK